MSVSWQKHKLGWSIFLVVLLVGTFMYSRPLPALYPINAYVAAASSTASKVKLVWPSGSEAAIGALGYGILETHGEQTPLPTASTAKLITALTVLKKYPLEPGQSGPIITLKGSDVAIYNQYLSEDGSVVRVGSGEKISEYQMLEAMLLPSANNMADSLAIWAYGSLYNYQKAAQLMVKTLGLNDTIVGTDASGFLPATKSTAHDLVLLGEAALDNPLIAKLVNKTQAALPLAGVVRNVNGLLGKDGIVGIKTGNNNQDGGVFIFASKQLIAGRSITIVGAVQGASTLQQAMDESLPLLNSADANFSLQTVVKKGQVIGYYNLPWGGSVKTVAAEAIEAIVWNNQLPKLIPALDALYAPKSSGAISGSLGTNAPDSGTTHAVLEQNINSPSLFWRLVRHKF